MPDACLVGRDHRALQILLQCLDDPDAAEAGTEDEYAVGVIRAGGFDLAVEWFDLLLETETHRVHVAGRWS